MNARTGDVNQEVAATRS